MSNKESRFGLVLTLIAASGLTMSPASAAPVPLTLHGLNDITTLVSYETWLKDDASLFGYSGEVIDGGYHGGALAYTLTTATGASLWSAFYDSEWAVVKVTWDVQLEYNATVPVDLYLDLDAFVTTDDFCLLAASCSSLHGIEVTFAVWGERVFPGLPPLYGLAGYHSEKLDGTGSVNNKLLLAQSVRGPFNFHVVFDNVAYSDIFLGSVSTSSALGSVNFALTADAVPEPSSLLLLGFGLAGLGGLRRWRVR